MPNSHMFACTMPAERARGCRLATDFRDAFTMARDGWTAFGTPTYAKGGGAILNGTTDSLMRPLAGELNSTELTFHLEFAPTFAANDGGNHPLMDTGSTGRFIITKGASDTLAIYAGAATLVANIAYATFGPVWKQNQRNLLSISTVAGGGTTNVWLNGSLMASVATAWAVTATALLYLGKSGAGYFHGTISRLYIYNSTSTLQEHLDIWNNKTWKWQNALTYDFPFTTGRYDPTNKRTLDALRDDVYATLGNGAGTGEPTQGKGYLLFDGVNDYLSGISDPTGSFTVLGVKDIGAGWEFFSDNDLTHWTPIFTSGSFTGKLSHLAVAPSVLTETQELDAKYKWISNIGAKI